MIKGNREYRHDSHILFYGMLSFFLLIGFNTAVQFFSTKYTILVEDSFFETVNRTADYSFKHNRRLVLQPLSNLEKKRRSFIGTEIPVALIAAEKDFSFNEAETTMKQNGDGLELHYIVDETVLVPSIPADFQAAAKTASPLSPKLSVTITTPDTLPKNFRALPVNGLYAGEKTYPLMVQHKVRCTILAPQFKEAIADFCAQLFTPLKPKQKQTAFVAGVGDLMLERGVQDILINDEFGLQKVFTDTLPILQNNDITIGNLEGAVTETEIALAKTYTFKFHKEVLPQLKAAGFNYLMLSNNHCYDYGEAGFKDTLAALAEYGIQTSGAGAIAAEAKKFYRAEKKGQKFSIISCGMYPVERSGFNGKYTATATQTRAGILWADDDVVAAVAQEKAAGNFVIVNVHGGTEYRFTPNKTQQDFYRALCDAGADVVFGSHPHVLQPIEWYKNSLIIYSLGNFIFNGMDGFYGATDTEIIRLGVYDGKILYAEKYPARIDGTRVLLR